MICVISARFWNIFLSDGKLLIFSFIVVDQIFVERIQQLHKSSSSIAFVFSMSSKTLRTPCIIVSYIVVTTGKNLMQQF